MINYNIIEQGDKQIVAAMTFPRDHDYFDGHFDGLKILPAVAQLFVAEQIAQSHWGELPTFKALKQVKFRDPIFPEMPLTLTLSLKTRDNATELAFCYQSGQAIKSSGKISYAEQA